MASDAAHDLPHFRTCPLCEAMCGVEIRTRGPDVLSIRGDAADPFSRGHICAKAAALQDVQMDADRLREPVRRVGEGWERISWATAFDEVARQLVAIQARHGLDSVATYLGNPTVHSYTALLAGARFGRALRSRNRYSATSVDQLPHQLVASLMYGHSLLLPIPDIDHTQFLLVIGANPIVSNGSLMSAPDVARRLKDLRSRGGQLVVVDPRRTETAERADQHLFIRPGTDAWLLLGLLQVIFADQLLNPGRLAGFTDGLDQIGPLVRDFTPARVAGQTGVAAADIRDLARRFAGASSAVCYGRMGVSTQRFGSLAQWLIQVLNIVTGNLDRVGGALLTQPAFDPIRRAGGQAGREAFNRRQTRVRGLPEFAGEYPVATLAEEILTPGKGQVRALLTAAGNPVLSTPNGRQLEQALGSLDYMVAIDFYINETTRHANVILPPTFALEHDHYDLVFHALAIRNTARYSQPLFQPASNTRHDWQIFMALVHRIEQLDPSRRGGLRQRLADRMLTPRRVLGLGLRFGRYGPGRWPWAKGLTLKRLARMPHGIDLGPLEPSLPARLATANHRIALAPEVLVREVDRLEASVAADAEDPLDGRLLLIGRRDPRSNNSWMHNSHRLVKGPARCTMRMHPEDARQRGLTDGALARVSSRVGSIDIPVELSDELMRGVVSIPHGWGHHRPGLRLATATRFPGVSVNDLTDERLLDALSGNAALNGLPVVVEPATAVTAASLA